MVCMYIGTGLTPTISLNVRQSIRVNIGQSRFLFPPDEVDGLPFRAIKDAVALVSSSNGSISDAQVAVDGPSRSLEKPVSVPSEVSEIKPDAYPSASALRADSTTSTSADSSADRLSNDFLDRVIDGLEVSNKEASMNDYSATDDANDGCGGGADQIELKYDESADDDEDHDDDSADDDNEAYDGEEAKDSYEYQERRQSLIENLITMGFPIDWALRAAESSDSSTTHSAAIAWIIERMELEQTKIEDLGGDSR